MSKIANGLLAAALLFATAYPADAFSLRKAMREVRNVVNTAPSIARSIPSPLNTQIDIITGRTRPADIVQNEGRRLQDLAGHVRQIDNTIHDTQAAVGQAIGGDLGRIVVEFSSAGRRLQNEFVFSATGSAGAVLQGGDPLLVVATPLAAAIRDARNKYHPTAKPLPDEFKQLLAPFVPSQLLSRARYSVDNLKISLPSALNLGHGFFGSHHAVVVDDIIVFSREPNANNPGDIFWVAHELHHVQQYASWGVDQFALNYIRNYRRVEAEADQAATIIHNLVMQAGDGQPIDRPSMMVGAMLGQGVRDIQTPWGMTQIAVPQSPGVAMAAMGGLTDRCFVAGEPVFITVQHQVVAPMRFNQVVAQRFASSVFGCAFELIGPNSRLCIASSTGLVFVPNYPYAIGQCVSCQFGGC